MIFNSKKENKYEWYAGGCAPSLYPTRLFFGDFILPDGKRLYIPESKPFAGTWGISNGTALSSDDMRPAPAGIDIIWLSLVENQFYSLQAQLPTEKIAALLAEVDGKTKKPKYDEIIVGMAPYGGLAVWLSGGGMETLVTWLQAEPVDVDMKDFAPGDIPDQTEYVETYLKNSPKACNNLQKNGLPDRMLYNHYMQQFNYRFTIRLENEEAALGMIESYYDSGECNIYGDYSDEHFLNTMRTKPRKIVITWRVGKIKYEAYIWTDENKVIETFDKYYQGNVQKKGELVFEIGKDNNKFRIYLQDKNNNPENPAPIVEFPDEELQILVFKDGWECYRNPSYNRPKGSWKD